MFAIKIDESAVALTLCKTAAEGEVASLVQAVVKDLLILPGPTGVGGALD